MGEHRRYTHAERVETLGLALSLGPKEASKRTGVPQRTIKSWYRLPEYQHIVASQGAELERTLVETHALAIERLRERLQDPKANLAHVAKAVEVLRDSIALLRGEATERVESKSMNLNVNASEPDLLLSDRELGLLERYLAAAESGSAITFEKPAELPATTEDDDHVG